MDNAAQRNLAAAWIGALVLLGAIACASCWLSVRSLNEGNDSRLLVAVSRQRMLSQRVALLAHQYVAAEDQYVRLDLRWELRACADQLLDIMAQHMQPGLAWNGLRSGSQAVDEEPLTSRPLSAALSALYNEPPTLLQYHVTELAGAVRQLAMLAADEVEQEPSLAGLVQSRANALLPSMDKLVDQVLAEHQADIRAQVSLQYRILAGTLVALLLAALMLAIPGWKLARAGSA